VYWHSHFATIGTPSGVTLAPEGAQHSWKSDIQMPNSITWEPCFAKELEWILADSLGRHFKGESFNREGALIRCTTKGIVQKEFLERLKQQPRFSSKSEPEIYSEIRKDVLEGGYCLIDYRHEEDAIAGDNLLHIFAMGALVPEAIKASDILKTKGILANVFVVTSPDLLLGNFAYDNNYRHLKEGLGINGNLYLSNGKIENESQWHAVQGARVPILSTHDGEPGLLDNIGSIVGTYHKTLAIRKTSKSGTTKDVFYYHHIDAEGLVNAANDVLEEMTTEKLVLPERILEKSF
jgi:pyruvate dehydrogenase E1 component